MRHLYNGALQLDRSREKRRLTSITHAGVVHEVLRDFAAREATVYAWLAMPDHIHVLFSTERPHRLDEILGRIKRRINAGLARRGLPRLHWRQRAVNHPVTWAGLADAREYILQNPVRGLLVATPQDWPHQGRPAPLPGV
ncbi:MAG: transposase [Planctomycetes bacterium]|nr:transposase [Planctomycetota bacterium]MCL4730141.1 transposase [Planctomycetota bacterium]